MTHDSIDNKIESFEYCFVLGAGSSCDFGYPTGLKLIENIADKLRSPHKELLLSLPKLKLEIPKVSGNEPEDLKKYCEILGARIFYSGVTSIDRFLSINFDNSLCQTICKYLIIEEILISERRSLNLTKNKENGLSAHCYRWEQNWLRILFGCFFVKDTIDELTGCLNKEKICFISFNYDRLLEYFLISSIVNLYGLKLNDLVHYKKFKSVFEAINIKHVYGRFDGDNAALNKLLDSYGHEKNEEIVGLLDNIKTMRNDNHMSESYSQIIQNSKKVYFLGFGFDEMNVDILFNGVTNIKRIQFYATNYGLSESIKDIMDVKFNKSIFWANETRSKVSDFIADAFGR